MVEQQRQEQDQDQDQDPPPGRSGQGQLVDRLRQLTTALEGGVLPIGGRGSEKRNFLFGPHDLNKRDWVLTEQRNEDFDERVPNFQGAEVVSMYVESDDDRQFDVLIRNLSEQGNVKTEVDNNVDSELRSTSPSGVNHHVFVTIDITDKWTDVVFQTVNTGNPNRIQGNFNFH